MLVQILDQVVLLIGTCVLLGGTSSEEVSIRCFVQYVKLYYSSSLYLCNIYRGADVNAFLNDIQNLLFFTPGECCEVLT